MRCWFRCLVAAMVKIDEDSGGMWCVVMFDLPVATALERRAAMRFRNLLLDMGY